MAVDQHQRLRDAADEARAAERAGEDWAAAAAWERHRLIEDALRDPQERLDLGIELSKTAIRLWMTSPAS